MSQQVQPYRVLLEVREVGPAAAVQQDLGGAQLLVDDGRLSAVQEAEACHHIPQHGQNHLVVQHHLLAHTLYSARLRSAQLRNSAQRCNSAPATQHRSASWLKCDDLSSVTCLYQLNLADTGSKMQDIYLISGLHDGSTNYTGATAHHIVHRSVAVQALWCKRRMTWLLHAM